jgi:hypothetical protein
LAIWFVPAEKNWMSLAEGIEDGLGGSQKSVARYIARWMVSAMMFLLV